MPRDLTTTRGVRESIPGHDFKTSERIQMHKALLETANDLEFSWTCTCLGT